MTLKDDASLATRKRTVRACASERFPFPVAIGKADRVNGSACTAFLALSHFPRMLFSLQPTYSSLERADDRFSTKRVNWKFHWRDERDPN